MRYFTPIFHSMPSDSCILPLQLIFFGPATVQMLCDHRCPWLVASVLWMVWLRPSTCSPAHAPSGFDGARGAGSEQASGHKDMQNGPYVDNYIHWHFLLPFLPPEGGSMGPLPHNSPTPHPLLFGNGHAVFAARTSLRDSKSVNQFAAGGKVI